MVDDVVEISRLKAEAKGLHLDYSVDPTISDWRIGDADRLHQVLRNLVTNAKKFTREGRIDVEVSAVATGTAERLIRFAVTDTGPGIPGKEIDRILEPFAQVWGSDADRGSGLGLPISDRLVKAMGGEGLAVASLEGHGSTFHFTIPLPESEVVESSRGISSPVAARRLRPVRRRPSSSWTTTRRTNCWSRRSWRSSDTTARSPPMGRKPWNASNRVDSTRC